MVTGTDVAVLNFEPKTYFKLSFQIFKSLKNILFSFLLVLVTSTFPHFILFCFSCDNCR